MDALGGVSSSPTSLSLFKNGGNTSSLRTPLRGGRRREERRWTVHSKCCSTGSACPVAIGHRDSIQQEMLKRYLSDLLGELCLFASADFLSNRTPSQYFPSFPCLLAHDHLSFSKKENIRQGRVAGHYPSATQANISLFSVTNIRLFRNARNLHSGF